MSNVGVPNMQSGKYYFFSSDTSVACWREYRDPKVAAADSQTRSGRKWNVEEELQVVEERIKHKKILGTISTGRVGLHQISKAKGKEMRQIMQDEVRARIEETRLQDGRPELAGSLDKMGRS